VPQEPSYRALIRVVPRFGKYAVVAVRPKFVEVLRVMTDRTDAMTFAESICEAATAAGLPTSLE
jgi:hypothetical protein